MLCPPFYNDVTIHEKCVNLRGSCFNVEVTKTYTDRANEPTCRQRPGSNKPIKFNENLEDKKVIRQTLFT